jgi:hypothetical protein
MRQEYAFALLQPDEEMQCVGGTAASSIFGHGLTAVNGVPNGQAAGRRSSLSSLLVDRR